MLYIAETAENIGYSCNLLREEMNEVFIISGNSPEEVKQELRSEKHFRKCFHKLISKSFHAFLVFIYFLVVQRCKDGHETKCSGRFSFSTRKECKSDCR